MEWSNCGQVFYLEGIAWALTADLRRIPLGKTQDIQKYLTSGEIPKDATPDQQEAWEYIIEYRKENGFYGNQSETKRVGNFRNRPTRDFEHRTNTSKRNAPAKRLPVRQT